MSYEITKKKIDSFCKLPKGWHYGEGVPASKKRIEKAHKINDFFHSYGVNTDAFPGIEGEIQVTAYLDEYYWEVTIERDNSIVYVFEVNEVERECTEKYTWQQVRNKVERFLKGLGNEKKIQIKDSGA